MGDVLAEAIDSLLRREEETLTVVQASPAESNKTVFFQSKLLLTNQRVLEVKVSLGSALVGKRRVSSVSVGLDEILQCDFRKGNLLWKSGSKNVVVVATSRGEFAWATPRAKVGEAFVAEVNAVLQGR